MYSDELYHIGTKEHSGRYPWGSGDRPYQRLKKYVRNKKAESKAKSEEKKNKKLEEKAARKAAIDQRKDRIKNIRSLSDDDVKKLVERLQNEKKIKELNEEDLAPGRAAVKRILKDVGSDIGKTAVSAAIKYYVRKAAGEDVSGKDFAAYFRPKK